MNRSRIVQALKTTLQKTDPFATVILYGSEARGDTHADSDIDLLILVDKEHLSYKDKIAITYPLYDIELKYGVSISPLVYTKKEWNSRPFKTPFYVNVMNEGIVLN